MAKFRFPIRNNGSSFVEKMKIVLKEKYDGTEITDDGDYLDVVLPERFSLRRFDNSLYLCENEILVIGTIREELRQTDLKL